MNGSSETLYSTFLSSNAFPREAQASVCLSFLLVPDAAGTYIKGQKPGFERGE